MTTSSIADLISNSAFSILVENLPQAVLLETADRRIKLVNPAFCALFRIPVQPEQLIGADCSNAADQAKGLFARPSEFVSRIHVLLEKREKSLGETLRMADGKVLLRDFIPLYNEQEFTGLLWTYTDITHHTHTEELEIQQTVNYFLSSLYNRETVDDILWDVARNCIGRLGFTDCVIYLLSADGSCLEQRAAWGINLMKRTALSPRYSFRLAKGLLVRLPKRVRLRSFLIRLQIGDTSWMTRFDIRRLLYLLSAKEK